MSSKSNKCKVPWCLNIRKLTWVSFHVFPQESVRLDVWCNAIGIDCNPKLATIKSNKVCSDHFSLDQFTSHNKLRLKKNAVPYVTNPGFRQLENSEGVVQELPGKSVSRSPSSTSAKSAFKLIASKSSAVTSKSTPNFCHSKLNLTNVDKNVHPMPFQSTFNSKTHIVGPPQIIITSFIPAPMLDTSTVLRINTADVVQELPGKSISGSTLAGSTSLVESTVKIITSSASSAPNLVTSPGPCRKKFKFSRITSTSKSQSSSSHATSDNYGPSSKSIIEIYPCALTSTLNSTGTMIISNMFNYMTTHDPNVLAWLNEIENCKEHRLEILNLVLRAKLFLTGKQKNRDFKKPKSWDQTRLDLRNQ